MDKEKKSVWSLIQDYFIRTKTNANTVWGNISSLKMSSCITYYNAPRAGRINIVFLSRARRRARGHLPLWTQLPWCQLREPVWQDGRRCGAVAIHIYNNVSWMKINRGWRYFSRLSDFKHLGLEYHFGTSTLIITGKPNTLERRLLDLYWAHQCVLLKKSWILL